MSNRESNSKHKTSTTDAKSFEDMPAKISKLLAEESDRGTILILAAYLEELLSFIIREACVSDLEAESLLETHGPADDFEAKVRLCRAFGLIHPDEAKALEYIRKIRNNAAHFNKKGRGFDVLFNTLETGHLVTNLTKTLNIELDSRGHEAVRDGFIMGSRLLAIQILLRLIKTERPKHPRSIREAGKEIPDELKEKLSGKLANEYPREDIARVLELLETITLKARSAKEIQKEREEAEQ